MHTLPGVFYCFFSAIATATAHDGHELRRPIVGHGPRKFPAAPQAASGPPRTRAATFRFIPFVTGRAPAFAPRHSGKMA